MAKQEKYRGYAVGPRIVTFPRGSWQEKEHAKSRHFRKPIPAAERLNRTPPAEVAQPEVETPMANAAELIVAAAVEQPVANEAAQLIQDGELTTVG